MRWEQGRDLSQETENSSVCSLIVIFQGFHDLFCLVGSPSPLQNKNEFHVRGCVSEVFLDVNKSCVIGRVPWNESACADCDAASTDSLRGAKKSVSVVNPASQTLLNNRCVHDARE